ncbi:MAG: SMC family ATPase, partial [Actinobacteria bacterium]|nr:SMC family ATPase [Actinomycetota bacterium]
THVATVAERWDRRHQATVERARLEAVGPTVEAGRTRLASALDAEAIRPSLEAAEAAAESVERARRAAARHRHRAVEARRALHRTPAELAEPFLADAPAAVAVAAARRAVAVEAAALDAAAARQRQVAELRAGAAELHASAQANRTLTEQGTTEVHRLRTEAAAASEALTVATTARDRLEGLTAAAERAEAQAAAAVRLHGLRQRLEAADAERHAAQARAMEAWSAHLDLRSQYLDGIAAVLAQGLVPGSPCQVCGATDHPDPAEPGHDAVTLPQVEAAEAASDLARTDAERCAELAAALASDVAVEAAAAGAAADDPAAAHEAAATARHKVRVATELAAKIGAHQAELNRVQTRAGELEELATAAGQAAEAARRDAVQLEAQAAAIAAELAHEVGAGLDPTAARHALDAFDAALVALVDHAGAGDDARRAQEAAEARLAADLAASRFADLDELRGALLAAEERRRLAEEVEQHDLRWATVLDALANPLLADLPAARPDAELAAHRVAEARTASDLAVARRSRVQAAHARIDQLAHEHRELLATVVPLESEAVLHEAVANRCAGKVAPKVSLQRWVLATYLEAICEHANRRLATMTAGRYQLVVVRESGHAGAKAGLDLVVHDAHTGTHRPVSDLSGGETFQASLALALGVADSVEARTGGVRLDALFIDEGFGTLDADLLQLALDELDGLRAGGRMVGVISHVGALRERIRTGIEVVRTGEQGSSVRVGAISAA